MKIKLNLITKLNKEKLFDIYKEVSTKIEDGTYEKIIKENINKLISNNNPKENNDDNNKNENNENMLKILSQLKNNINNYKVDFSLYKDSENDIEIINKNYIHINPNNNFFTFKSYPSENLLILILNNILLCFLNKEFCFKFHYMESFNKSEVDSIAPLNNKIKEIIKDKDVYNKINKYIIDKIFIDFNCRDLLTFLGIRKTTGSIDYYIPLDKNMIINKFKELNNPKSTLTVGAKALCKHSHRSVTDPFWPGQGGKEKEKNENAEKMLNLFLKECVWINIHLLPHQLVIIELRIDKGYGIRWQANDGMFRGFLEPQMEDGHEKGWIH